MAKERIYYHNQADKALKSVDSDLCNISLMSCFRQNTNHQSQDEKHNNFNGMVWALFNKGKIFEKMAQHPVILNTSNIIIGENSAVSSLAANTVLPGNGGMKDQLIKSLRVYEITLQASFPTWTTPTTGCSCPPPTRTSWTTLPPSPSSSSPSSPTSTPRTAAPPSGPTRTTSPATRTTRRSSTRTRSRSQARPAT